MRILGISGSPKKRDNEKAIDFCLDIAKAKGFETEILFNFIDELLINQ